MDQKKKKKKNYDLLISDQHDFSPIPCNVIICDDGRRTHELVMREKRNKSRNHLKMVLVSSGWKRGMMIPHWLNTSYAWFCARPWADPALSSLISLPSPCLSALSLCSPWSRLLSLSSQPATFPLAIASNIRFHWVSFHWVSFLFLSLPPLPRRVNSQMKMFVYICF